MSGVAAGLRGGGRCGAWEEHRPCCSTKVEWCGHKLLSLALGCVAGVDLGLAFREAPQLG